MRSQVFTVNLISTAQAIWKLLVVSKLQFITIIHRGRSSFIVRERVEERKREQVRISNFQLLNQILKSFICH